MACPVRNLPAGSRLTDYISLGVITRFVLRARSSGARRDREGEPASARSAAHIVVYYVTALALYMQCSYREVLHCLLEGLVWLKGPGAELEVASKSDPQARRAIVR